MQEPEDNIVFTIFKSIPPVNSEGWKFIAIFAVATAILGMFSCALFWVGIVLTLWCAYFFRDPVRSVPTRSGLVLSPADGTVQRILKMTAPGELGMDSEPHIRVSIFLNVFDVHVNRIPINGRITALHYRPGAFFNASLDKASEENERQYISVAAGNNQSVGVVQIAGLIARRIVCNLTTGQEVSAGARFGLIRFGSRVDVYLPASVQPLVIEGQRVVGGETVLADLESNEQARTGNRI